MESDRISIIVPVFNLEKELSRCLDSILMQTYNNLEVIVVDDGSIDGSREQIEKYAFRDKRVRTVFKENGGVTSARLRAIEETTGEWIGFVDGDDEIDSDMYERLLTNARKYNAEVSHCGYQMNFADGRVNWFHNTGLLELQDKVTALKELLSGERIEPGLCNKLFHRNLFHTLMRDRLMDTQIKINEDLLMNYYLFSAAEKIVYEDWCPYHYIVRSTSASRAKLNTNKIYDPIRVKEIICQAASKDILEDAQRAYINTCINAYHGLIVAGQGYQKDIKTVRELVYQQREHFHLLGKKRGLMAQLIVYAPGIYKPIYGLYCRFLQRNVYS